MLLVFYEQAFKNNTTQPLPTPNYGVSLYVLYCNEYWYYCVRTIIHVCMHYVAVSESEIQEYSTHYRKNESNDICVLYLFAGKYSSTDAYLKHIKTIQKLEHETTTFNRLWTV